MSVGYIFKYFLCSYDDFCWCCSWFWYFFVALFKTYFHLFAFFLEKNYHENASYLWWINHVGCGSHILLWWIKKHEATCVVLGLPLSVSEFWNWTITNFLNEKSITACLFIYIIYRKTFFIYIYRYNFQFSSFLL